MKKEDCKFWEKFKKEYLKDGLGAMSKRNIDVLVFYLLIENEFGAFLKPKRKYP